MNSYPADGFSSLYPFYRSTAFIADRFEVDLAESLIGEIEEMSLPMFISALQIDFWLALPHAL